MVPASLILLVGFFVHLNRRDLERLIRSLPQLCARDAIVVWAHSWTAKRHSVATINERFRAADFSDVPSGVEPSTEMHVAVERFDGVPQPLRRGVRLFTFRRATNGPAASLRRLRAALASRSRRVVDILGKRRR